MPYRTIPALDWNCLKGNTEIEFGKWEKSGILLQSDQPWEEGLNPTIFPSTVLDCGPVRRFYYSLISCMDNRYAIVLAEQDVSSGRIEKHLLSLEGNGHFTLEGLSEGLMPIQPNVFRLGEQDWRMYFWTHFHGTPRRVEMLAAESNDGLRWRIANDGKPILRHHTDAECTAGRWPHRLRCNDATALYHNPDGSWEIFSAALVTLDPKNKRFANQDIWRGYVRIIQRWTSADGWNWNDPEIIAAPDAEDPVDLQFYYLVTTPLDWGTLGLLGRFSGQTQRLAIEPVFSTDHRTWERPFRKNCLPQEEPYESVSVVPSQTMLRENNRLRLYYSGSNFDHNFKTMDGSLPKQVIASATIDRHCVFGRRMKDAVLLSPRLRLNHDVLRLHISSSSLKMRWTDIFTGEALSDFLPLSGSSSPLCISVPENLRGNAACIELAGNGTIFDLEY